MENVNKAFKIVKTKPGLWGSIQSLFHREYIIKQAVEDISFQIEKGEVVGYIGPNGAGKSTTIKMLSGVLTPDSGSIHTGDLVPYENRKANARQIGVVFGQRSQLYWDLPVSDTFDLYQKLYDIPMDVYKKNKALFTELLEMEDFLPQPVRQLSLGQKMKANLALAMLHNPPILYLDEPTIGLDVMTKQRLRSCINQINKECGTTVILTTHDMRDIEEVCQRIILIDKGKKLYDGKLTEFKKLYAQGGCYKLEFETLPKWKEREGFSVEQKEENVWIVRTRQPYSKEILIDLIHEYNPVNIYSEEVSIEDIVSDIFRNAESNE